MQDTEAYSGPVMLSYVIGKRVFGKHSSLSRESIPITRIIRVQL